MATKINKALKHADPMKTKTGKVRLGPLNLEQLNKLLEQTSKPKIKVKILNEIKQRK